MENISHVEIKIVHDELAEDPITSCDQPAGFEAVNPDRRTDSPCEIEGTGMVRAIAEIMGDWYNKSVIGYLEVEGMIYEADYYEEGDTSRQDEIDYYQDAIDNGAYYTGYLDLYIPKETIKTEWAGDKEKAIAYLKSVDDEYRAWANGECYGYQVFLNGEEIGSCYGYIGEAGKGMAEEDAIREISF